ncbi:hypothetical protein BDZ97DRAFT_1942720 [Flammula alnicola]|nr:hypothetical protein BDZ97DRAFT_1942720 [Flammula alnicola]
MSSPDPISLVALIISLVALILTLLQVAQQYVATGYDYRHCSERTLGGWHKRSRRQFIWRELRFEVHFTAPIIHIGILPSDSTDGGDAYAVPTTSTVTEKTSRSRSASSTSGARYILHGREGDKIYTSSQNPWFLDPKGTRPEAKCTWLSLLNDTTITHLQIGIDELALSYDFMPDGIKKPLAQMDRKSFLTLMSLFQVSWQEGWGAEKTELGGGKRGTPTGAGPYGEVTSRNLANFGPVISYQPSNFPPTKRFYIVSEKARSAMFSRFDLGFHVVLTHSADEVYRSALALADEQAADTVQGFFRDNNGYSPGLAEVIECFAEPEMPKAIEHGTDTFISIFSARSVGTLFDQCQIVQLLIGEEVNNSTPLSKTITTWAMDWASSVKDNEVGFPADQLQAALKFARRYFGTPTHQREPISWSESRRSLHVIKFLDKQLSNLCHLLAPGQSELSVHREFAKLQIRFGSTLFHDTSAMAQPSRGHWLDFVGAFVAEKYVEISSILGEKYPGSREEVRHGYVINRLARGVLWVIHNGNCSSNQTHDERLLECSLNSRWLSDTSTLWID